MGKHKKKEEKLILHELNKRIKKLEAAVDKLNNKPPEYHINIDKLDIHELDNLTFHLDKLEIEDLSGALNLGNNFGTRLNKDKDGSLKMRDYSDKRRNESSPSAYKYFNRSKKKSNTESE